VGLVAVVRGCGEAWTVLGCFLFCEYVEFSSKTNNKRGSRVALQWGREGSLLAQSGPSIYEPGAPEQAVLPSLLPDYPSSLDKGVLWEDGVVWDSLSCWGPRAAF
jgi:hypothetical protein